MSTRGDESAFAQRAEPFRRELLAHCYRMLGSVDAAEDAVQDTFLRAWRAFGEFRGDSSLRTWLYRIATNVVLSALEQQHTRRWLPSGLGPPLDDAAAAPAPDQGIGWIEAMPDDLVGTRQHLRLALIAALQALPARQRAVLLLREVVGLSAEEVAKALDTTIPAVKSALQRARATLDALDPVPDDVAEPESPVARELLARYIAAFETSDLTQLEDVLRDDAAIEVVPTRGWFAGKATCLRFLARVLDTPGSWQMSPTRANGQPAAIAWHRGAPFGIGMLDVTATGIIRIVAFGDSRATERFNRLASTELNGSSPGS
jgi:RNA polymerase sigma-70 factor (ECF subfamily)